MAYRDTYFKLNWHFLNAHGLTKSNGILTIDADGCEFTKGVGCPFSLAIIIYMASHNEVSIILSDTMYEHFFNDSRGNLFYFEAVLERLLKEDIIMKVE